MQALYLPHLDAHLGYHDLPGTLPACIYLHGLGSASSADFPRITGDACLVSYRSILVDCLGFGFSDHPPDFSHTLEDHADIVAMLIDSLGLNGCRIIGHSWGGSVAIALAARRPELVTHLIVLEPNLLPEDATLSQSIADQTEDEYVASGHDQFIAQAEGWAAADLPIGSYPATVRVADPRAMHRASSHLVRASLRDTLLGLTMSRSYLVGEQSLPDPHSEILQDGGVRVVVLPNVGHAMQNENPGSVAAVLNGEFQLTADQNAAS